VGQHRAGDCFLVEIAIELATERRGNRDGYRDRCERASGLLLDGWSGTVADPGKQYLFIACSLSSLFFTVFPGPQKRAKCPYAGGYGDLDRSCRPSPIKVSEIADFKAGHTVGQAETKRPRLRDLRHNYPVIGGVKPLVPFNRVMIRAVDPFNADVPRENCLTETWAFSYR
jgi:hypothetical protein